MLILPLEGKVKNPVSPVLGVKVGAAPLYICQPIINERFECYGIAHTIPYRDINETA
jgi:hypothetical protein